MIVLDNSVFIAALLGDENEPLASHLLRDILEGEQQAIVPPVFFYEATNVVMTSLRRKRITAKLQEEYCSIIYELSVQIEKDQSVPAVVRLAQKNELSTYDASYLEIAKRRSLPLATLDRSLFTAGRKEKVVLVPL